MVFNSLHVDEPQIILYKATVKNFYRRLEIGIEKEQTANCRSIIIK